MSLTATQRCSNIRRYVKTAPDLTEAVIFYGILSAVDLAEVFVSALDAFKAVDLAFVLK